MSEKLHGALVDNGSYTKSYDEFVDQFSTEEAQDRLYNALNQSGDYTKSSQEFKNQFFTKNVAPPVDAPVEEDDMASDSSDISSELPVTTEDGPIVIPDVSAETVSKDEDEATGELFNTYGRYGFTFKKAGFGTDNVIVVGPDGEESPIFSLDNWSDEDDFSSAAAITQWMQERVKEDKATTLLAAMSDVEVTEEQTAENAVMDEDAYDMYFATKDARESQEENFADEQAEYERQKEQEVKLEIIPYQEDHGIAGNEDQGKIDIRGEDTHIRDVIEQAKMSVAIQRVMKEKGVDYETALEKHGDEVKKIANSLGDGRKVYIGGDIDTGGLDVFADEENFEIDEPEVREKVIEILNKESHARSLEQNIGEYVKQFEGGIFSKGEQQKELEKAAEEELKKLEKKDKEFVSKFSVIETSIQDVDKELSKLSDKVKTRQAEIKQIRSKEYTTQEEVDKANARLEVLRQESISDQSTYKTLFGKRKGFISAAGLMVNEQEELRLKEEDLSVYFKAIGKNYQLGTIMGVTLMNATIDIGANLEEFAYALNPYVAVYNYLDQEDISPIVKSLITTASMYVPPAGVLAAQAQLGTSGEIENPYFNEDEPESEDNPRYISYRDNMVNSIYNFQEEMRNSIAEPIRMEDIESWSDLGTWAGTTVAQMAPLLALMYATGGTAVGTIGGRSFTAAEGLIFSSSAGGKFRSMKREIDQYGADYSWLQMYSTALLTGAAETLSEQITLGQMKNLRGMMNTNPAARLGFNNFLKREVWTAKNLRYVAKDFFEEGGSEAIATLSENFLDMSIMGKDVNIWDGVDEAFASGVLISGTMKVPSMYRAMSAPFRSRDTNQEVAQNAARINKLQKMAQKPGVLPENKAAYEAEIADLVVKNNDLIATDVKRVDESIIN
jgi:hypothetical protein